MVRTTNPQMGNPLIYKAKEHDKKTRAHRRKKTYTDDEIELAGAWFESEISTAAVAEILEVHSSNVLKMMATAIKQAIVQNRVSFVWYPPKGDRV